MAGYEFIRSASNSLFKAAYGVSSLPLLISLVPLVTLLILWIYGKVLSFLGPKATLSWTTLCSMMALLACYYLIYVGVKIGTILLFLVGESYLVLLIGQIWSLINSVINENIAKKYNGLLLAISTAGGIGGGLLVHQFAKVWGTEQMVLVGALLCLPFWCFSQLAYGLSQFDNASQRKYINRPTGDVLGLALFAKEPILLVIFAMVLASQFFGFFVNLHFQELLHIEIPNIDQQTSLSGLFFGIANAASVFLQLIMAPILLSSIPIPVIHIAIPLINLAFVLIAFIYPSVMTAGLAVLVFKSLDYSLFRAAKEILYIPLSFDIRFRAKELNDVFGYRFGKGIASLFVTIFEKFAITQSVNSLLLSLVIALAWFVAALPLPLGFSYFKKARRSFNETHLL